jgi:hypothetical protein
MSGAGMQRPVLPASHARTTPPSLRRALVRPVLKFLPTRARGR